VWRPRREDSILRRNARKVLLGHPPPPSLPYKVDTSRPSLRTNWTCNARKVVLGHYAAAGIGRPRHNTPPADFRGLSLEIRCSSRSLNAGLVFSAMCYESLLFSKTTPSLTSRTRVVSDSKLGALQKSPHLDDPHLNTLLPHPVKFKLAWSKQSGAVKVFVWRPLPPSDSFVALGMVLPRPHDRRRPRRAH